MNINLASEGQELAGTWTPGWPTVSGPGWGTKGGEHKGWGTEGGAPGGQGGWGTTVEELSGIFVDWENGGWLTMRLGQASSSLSARSCNKVW